MGGDRPARLSSVIILVLRSCLRERRSMAYRDCRTQRRSMGCPRSQTGTTISAATTADRRNTGRGRPLLGLLRCSTGIHTPSSYSEEDMGPPPPLLPDPAAVALTNEVDKLRGDINQLRDQTQAQMAPPAPAAAPVPAEPPPPATVLVLRDGKQVETTNYAVMDQMLWNFSARPVQKIPLTSIDLQASEKANSDRGVDFSLSADSDN